MSENRQIFTLKQVVSSIKKTIEERYQQNYWVKAEMHKMNLYPSGHAFPELVQKEDGKVLAQISGSIWKPNLQRINKQFIEIAKEPLKEGTTLLMLVKISFNETFGMSLQILDIDPNYSLGELQRERQETLLRLNKEGLLNLNQNLNFPLLPQRIAIISADTSKGLSDFMKVLDQNPWGYAFFSMLFPAYLQGDVAIDSIIEQLKRIEKVKEHFDLVVIVRGGGGEVGLSCYNHFDLCKAITLFPLPILTGIGHSTNLTVAEMVAFRHAITPTELADFLIQAFHEMSEPVQRAGDLIKKAAFQLLEQEKISFNHEVKNFKNHVKHNVQFHKNSLVQASRKLHAKTDLSIDRNRERIQFIHKELKQNTRRFLVDQNQYFDDTKAFLSQNSMQYIEKSENSLEHLSRAIALLNPKNVLKRGYSIARLNGKTISSKNQAKLKDLVEIETYDFVIEAEVKKVKK